MTIGLNPAWINAELTKLDIRPRDIVVLRGSLFADESARLADAIRSALRDRYGPALDVTIIYLPGDSSIESLPEDEMEEHGWVRADAN